MNDAETAAAVYRLSPSIRDFLAGGAAGIAGVLAGQPLDTIRIRVQHGAAGGGGAAAVARSLVAAEGVRSLFKGMVYPISTVAFASAVVFQAYGSALRYLRAGPGVEAAAAAPASYSQVFTAGCAAGVLQTACIVPIDLLKIRLQLQRALPGARGYVGPLQLLHSILRAEGLAGLYRGLGVTLVRDTPSHGVYFTVYDWCREAGEPSCRAAGRNDNHAVMLAAGGVAGVLSWLAVYPFDVIKSRMQATSRAASPYSGWLDCAAQSWRAEGGRVFWRGCGPTLARAFVVNAAVFWVYEGALRTLPD